MNLNMTIRLAWKNIRGNRLRSGLTILGLVIGIASVILLVGFANGSTEEINDEMASMGADIVSVSIYDSSKALNDEEVKELKSLENVADVSPYTIMEASISRGGTKFKNATIIGAGADYVSMMGYKIISGRSLSPIDVQNSTKAALIGKKIAKKLWKKEDPVGEKIKLNGDDYTVVGVLEGGSSMIYYANDTVILPLSTAKYIGFDTAVTELYVRSTSDETAEAAVKEIDGYLSKNKGLGEWDKDIYSQKEMIDSMEEINRTLSLLLGGIASISLLVGGIGVMNVMLVSVTERTREVGIRKSLGAKKRDILYQFLIESMVLSVFGGIVGIVSGVLIGKLVSLFAIPFAPSIGMIMLSFGVSVAVGLVFGILPSYRAACLKPVDALRYE